MIIECDDTLVRFTELITQCTEGRGSIGILSGGIGFGKTAMLEVLAERAAHAGCLVLSAAGSRAERSSPYMVIEQLFHGAAVTEADPGERDQALSASQVMQASYRALEERSSRQPVVLCIDDVHYADRKSLECLLYLIRRCRRIPVTIFLAHGTPGMTDRQSALAELACRPGVRTATLGALSQDGIAQLIVARFGPEDTERLALEIVQASGGNQLLVQALLNDHEVHLARGDAEDGPVAGDMLGDASVACVHRSGPDGLRLARGIAVLDHALSIATLGQLVGLDDRAAATALKALNESRLLDGGRFRHAAIRAAVLDDIPAAEREPMHRAAAWLLSDEGAPVLVIASHLLAGGLGQDEWAADRLVEAAEEQALAGGAAPLATRFLQAADNCCPSEDQRHVIKMRLAQILWRDRPEASVRMVKTLVAPVKAGGLPAVASLQVAHGLLMAGHIPDAVKIVERICAPGNTARNNADPQLSDELDVARMWLASTYPGAARLLEQSLTPPFAREPVSASPMGRPRLAANHALWAVLSHRPDDSMLAEAERVMQTLPIGDATLDTLTLAIMTLVYGDRLKAAAGWCDRFLLEAADRQAGNWKLALMSVRALIALRQGELRTAAALSLATLSSMSEEAWGVYIAMPLATLIETRIAMGQYESASELVSRPVPEAAFQTRYGLHYLYARGRCRMVQGYYDAAFTDFISCGEIQRPWGIDSPVMVPWRIGAAEVWLRRGQRKCAAKLADEHLALIDPAQRRAYGIALRTVALTREPSQRLEMLGGALEILQHVGDRYELALTLAEVASAHQRTGDVTEARLVVRRAWLMAEACGAEGLRSSLMPRPAVQALPPAQSQQALSHIQAQSQHTATADPPPGEVKVASLLSDAELRVTSLAAQGYTNRDISGKLFITVSTVEQHLTRAFRKLNIQRRQELAVHRV